jgi:CRISPR-associated RAMP protein (TIGR02581 family)
MHSRVYNEAAIQLSISPVGPILIKASDNTDPTKPDMSFVRTFRNGQETVYLPGSSLKGVLRAHCERLARTVDSRRRQERHQGKPLTCDPLNERSSCSGRLRENGKEWSGARKHMESCFLCRMFGNSGLASHFRITDAYPLREPQLRTEERNSVAIDRVYGSAIHGALFNYETVTAGSFQTKLYLKNFTLAQLGLLSLALRDLSLERVRLGFAKSRGLGLVSARIDSLTLRYPLCNLEGEKLCTLGSGERGADRLYGVGAFIKESADARDEYGYPAEDEVALPPGYSYASDGWMGTEISAPGLDEGSVDWQPLGRACVPKWKDEVEDDR